MRRAIVASSSCAEGSSAWRHGGEPLLELPAAVDRPAEADIERADHRADRGQHEHGGDRELDHPRDFRDVRIERHAGSLASRERRSLGISGRTGPRLRGDFFSLRFSELPRSRCYGQVGVTGQARCRRRRLAAPAAAPPAAAPAGLLLLLEVLVDLSLVATAATAPAATTPAMIHFASMPPPMKLLNMRESSLDGLVVALAWIEQAGAERLLLRLARVERDAEVEHHARDCWLGLSNAAPAWPRRIKCGERRELLPYATHGEISLLLERCRQTKRRRATRTIGDRPLEVVR